MKRRKRNEKRLEWLYRDHLELSFCPICWATVWMPHKRIHQQWHEVHENLEDMSVCAGCGRLNCDGRCDEFLEPEGG